MDEVIKIILFTAIGLAIISMALSLVSADRPEDDQVMPPKVATAGKDDEDAQ